MDRRAQSGARIPEPRGVSPEVDESSAVPRVERPYNQGGANQVRSGGAQSEVWLGRFSEDFSRIEAWSRVTNNRAVIPILTSGSIATRVPSLPDRPARWPCRPPHQEARTGSATPSRVVVEVRLAHAGPIPSPASILPYRHALVVNAYDVVSVVEGQSAQETIHVAQWAIR